MAQNKQNSNKGNGGSDTGSQSSEANDNTENGFGPVKDAETGKIIDEDPSDSQSGASDTSTASALASSLREGEVSGGSAENLFEGDSDELTSKEKQKLENEIGQEKLEQKLREKGKLNEQQGDTTAFVTGKPGQQETLGVGESRVEAAVEAAADDKGFDAYPGTTINQFEENIGTDQGLERPESQTVTATVESVAPSETKPNTDAPPRPASRDQSLQPVKEFSRKSIIESNQNTSQKQPQIFQINDSNQLSTTTATTSELTREQPDANLNEKIDALIEYLPEQTQRPAGEERFPTPEAVEDRTEEKPGFSGPVNNEEFIPNQEFASATDVPGTSFITQNLPEEGEDIDVLPVVDFNPGEKGEDVEEKLTPLIGENPADQTGFTATTGAALAQDIVNIPAAIGAFAEQPVKSAKAVPGSLADTIQGGSSDVAQARQGLLITGALTAPASAATSSRSVLGAGVTDDASSLTAAKRASGVQEAAEAKRILQSKGGNVKDKLVGSTSPRQDRIVFQSGESTPDAPETRGEFETINEEALPDLSQQFRDLENQRPQRVSGGAVDRPEEGLTPQEVEVLTGREPGPRAVRQEAEGGGIQEANTIGVEDSSTVERRVFSSGDVEPKEKALELEDLERARTVREGRKAARRIKEGATGKRKGQARLVTEQDNTGRNIDFERPADTSNIEPTKNRFETPRANNLDDAVDDFQSVKRGPDTDTTPSINTRIEGIPDTSLGTSLGVSQQQNTRQAQNVNFGIQNRQQQDVEDKIERDTESDTDIERFIKGINAEPNPESPLRNQQENAFDGPERAVRDNDDDNDFLITEFDSGSASGDVPNQKNVLGQMQQSGQETGFAPTVKSLFTGSTEKVTEKQAEKLQETTFTGFEDRDILVISDEGEPVNLEDQLNL